jgi:hypothetical protein
VEIQPQFDPTSRAFVIFAGFAALSVIGGLIGSMHSVRRSIGRTRPTADPADRRDLTAGWITIGALAVSMALAALGGVLLAAGDGGPVRPTFGGMEWTGLALGAALIGGTSAFGRRGGVFGTVLAALLVTIFIRWTEVMNYAMSLFAIAGAIVVGGLIVTRLVENYSRPFSAAAYVEERGLRSVRDAREDEDEWTPEPEPLSTSTGGWRTTNRYERQEEPPWTSGPSAQPAESRGDPWESDRWGSGSR